MATVQISVHNSDLFRVIENSMDFYEYYYCLKFTKKCYDSMKYVFALLYLGDN
jgi:hypothetical protein